MQYAFNLLNSLLKREAAYCTENSILIREVG